MGKKDNISQAPPVQQYRKQIGKITSDVLF